MNRKDYEDLQKMQREDFKETWGEFMSIFFPLLVALMLLVCMVCSVCLYEDVNSIKESLFSLASSGVSL